MWIKKFPHDFSRRHFLKQLSSGVIATGVLAPLWPTIARCGDVASAYPDELLSIEAYTKGAISTGDTISADNLEQVRDLLDPIRAEQIQRLGRKLRVIDTTTDIMQLNPWEYIEATLRHQGQATFDKKGNVVTKEGKPWIGGNPFPDSRNAVELFANATLSWGRHDISCYATKEYDLDAKGRVSYKYDSFWAELAPVGRITVEPKPYWPGHEDKLRYQSVFFVSPNEVKGTSFLNIWHYDQSKFPDLYGYLTAFKRVRRFPANQRFEPLVPGSTLYLSDAWAAGDPYLTWGNFRVVGQGPMLASVSRSWNADHDNWKHGTHGGPSGEMFWDTDVEMVPEAIVVDAEPVMYPRAPVSKKRVWFDARTLLPISMVTFDRRGKVFRSFDGAYSLYKQGDKVVKDGQHPYWSWTRLHAHNVQTDRITRLEQVKKIAGGYKTSTNDPSVYQRYLTKSALTQRGR